MRVYFMRLYFMRLYFMRLHTQPREMYEKYHCGVHVLANTGIMFYIKAREDQDIGL